MPNVQVVQLDPSGRTVNRVHRDWVRRGSCDRRSTVKMSGMPKQGQGNLAQLSSINSFGYRKKADGLSNDRVVTMLTLSEDGAETMATHVSAYFSGHGRVREN